ncbi:MAG: hypothetical protein COW30_04170 [Rhodospirillales bacterium CG15_BIG_FIL_POST_REV_8_21_14_020_66_15]|nr:MAG: hypothetical protein COW30_04170 [Rhodospirillales bacterium CG15_BIG_FIL_POST_REV_8_21_14_020_66_15]
MKKTVNPLLALQAAYFDALRANAKIGFDCWRAGVEGFWKVYHAQPHRRVEDAHEKAPCATGGANLAHKYGRRCHDVDVEHI